MMIRSILILLFSIISFNAISQTWTQKSSLTGSSRAVSSAFSIGTKGYIGTGINTTSITPNSTYYSDFWEYNQASNSWIQRASLPGAGRTATIGFSINNLGYIGLGWNGTTNTNFSDIQEYNPNSNSWIQKTTYPGQGSRASLAGVANNNLVVIGGSNGFGAPKSDIWKYNFTTNLWTQIQVNPLGSRAAGVSFTVDSLVYFGLGTDGSVNKNDFWCYNINTNLWSQIAVFPGVGRIQAVAIKVGDKIIVGSGHVFGTGAELNDYYEYDPILNRWSSIVGFTNGHRSTSRSFSIGNKGYITCGNNQNNLVLNDLWEVEYISTSLKENSSNNKLNIYPNPSNNEITFDFLNLYNQNSFIDVFNIDGILVLRKRINSNSLKLDLSHFENGNYIYRITGGDEISKGSFIVYH